MQMPCLAALSPHIVRQCRDFKGKSGYMIAVLKLLVGGVVGILVGLTGTGGAFVVPALVYLFRMGQPRARGTALLVSSLPLWIIPFIPVFRSRKFDLCLAF